jgi:superfamily II DNA or RNA helicase
MSITINLPQISKLLFSENSNEIWQNFGKKCIIENAIIVNSSPFIIRDNENNEYLFTNHSDGDFESYDYVLLTTKIPKLSNIDSTIITRWIKHPLFTNTIINQVKDSWVNAFRFIKENEEKNIKGLRPPQLGALYSILSHVQNADDKGIVVMPTGTGKTETMLATLIANECDKVLISVPSDSLRTQIFNKFLTLGLLKEFSIISSDCINPITGIIKSGFANVENLIAFISNCNVVVTTMNILSDFKEKKVLNDFFSHFFVDEAHHSEARTWNEIINRFDKHKVLLFTATPFRNDGKSLQGKVIFNFPLRKAQEQKYYKEINYLPIREYNKKYSDNKIAEKAIEQLKDDLYNGFNHIIMARCGTKKRAKEVFEYYKVFTEYNPILVYNGVAGLEKKIESIKNGEHLIIVCVNMLGEGFDLPNLKIAAIHDDKQSLPTTLQFIGRFTRTSYDSLGKASFITNIAFPPINEELNQLYARNADWNLLLPRISANATQKEINIKDFLDGFKKINESQIPFGQINPALSTIIYKNSINTWNPDKWSEDFIGINNYEHVFYDTNHKDTLVIILGKIERVEWGNFETVKNLHWDIIIVHWDLRPNINRVFINTSLKSFSANQMMDKIFEVGNTSLITGNNVFRIFHDVNQLSLFNVGTKKGIGEDITFQSYFGKGVQDGIKELEQGTLIKNNIFGVGYKEGEKVSLGCSVKGKIWSYQRGNLDELTKWCKYIGDIVEDSNIDPNIVLQNTLQIEKISSRPNEMPFLIDWNSQMYEYAEDRFQFEINDNIYDLADIELNILDASLDRSLKFSLDTTSESINFEIVLGLNPNTNESRFEIIKTNNITCSVTFGRKQMSIIDFLNYYPPIIWFSNWAQLSQNLYVTQKKSPGLIPLNKIFTDNWTGVNLRKESQDINPYIQDSIQYYFINKIKNDYKIIYDDDGKGEIADIVAINYNDDIIDIHLYHLKYSNDGRVNNNIDNFYQVCGQAQKSLKWKHREERELFNHLFKRKTKTLNNNSCNRLIKGTEEELEELLSEIKYSKPIKFYIHIVQPSLSKSNASNDILLLLGNVYHYLATVGNIELNVYCSE